MDATTPRGEVARYWQDLAAEAFHEAFPHLMFHPHANNNPSILDGWLVKKGKRVASVEAKSRFGITSYTLESQMDNEWLISRNKIEAMIQHAHAEGLHGVGWLILADQRMMMVRKLVEGSTAQIKDGVRFAVTKTKRTTNDGTLVERDNAFVDMTNARRIFLLPF